MEILDNNISNIENVTQYTTWYVFLDAWRVIAVINSVCKCVMILIPASRWSSARLHSVALRDKDKRSRQWGLQRSAHTVYMLTKLQPEVCPTASGRQQLFTQAVKGIKARTVDSQQRSHACSWWVPVVFFLFTVLSALCLFCKDT